MICGANLVEIQCKWEILLCFVLLKTVAETATES